MKRYSAGSVFRAGVWGTVLGGAAGFALGMLVAPEDGKKIRRRLAYQLENLSQQVGGYIDHLTQPAEQSAARQRGDALVADARERADQIRQDIDALLGEVKHGHSTGAHPSN